MQNCFHCGNDVVKNQEILFDEKSFCCTGCKTVYEIFSLNDMTCYYDFEKSPGATPTDIQGKFNFLDNSSIVSSLLDFEEENISIVTLYIPHIHCSSCIWILENLQKLQKGINYSQVNFPEKKVRITYESNVTSLKQIVSLLCSIGYEPYISLENFEAPKEKVDRSLIYKLGVAFFAFGNIMLLSFPEYFEVEEYWLNEYRGFFRWLIFALSLPSFLYAASGYYVSAYKSIRSKIPNIDIPIALGIIVMFVRSTVDIIFDFGQGFFDSLTGLIFFMLLGKLFQQRTYSFLSFERDYKSYFPIAVTRIQSGGVEESVQVYDIQKGDRLLIRNQELIPVDGILITNNATIDYSFVTGEAVPVHKNSGDKLFAGGKLVGQVLEMEVLFSVSQSYLTQLWSNDVFQKRLAQKHKTITDTVSRYFTPALLIIAFLGLFYWSFYSWNTAFNVFTAVLIVACPCAMALTAPFTLGNVLRIMGNRKFYLKNATVIEQLAKADTLVFDKTGTITTNRKSVITWVGKELTSEQKSQIKMILRGSNHPLSRMLYDFIVEKTQGNVIDFKEVTGKGIYGKINESAIYIGSASWVGQNLNENLQTTSVHIKINQEYLGQFDFKNEYRQGLSELFTQLGKKYELHVLSGDNEGDKNSLQQLLPPQTHLVFNKKPDEKLEYVKSLQNQGKNVLMMGDGLNDAGALAQSNVGISISENVNVFSPACDAILDASEFQKIFGFLMLSKKAILVIMMSFGLSIIYNIVGLSYAVSGNLLPIVAAIIMPLSSITVVSFVTIMSNWFAMRLLK